MSDREKLIELIKEAYCPVMCGFADEEKVKWLLELDIAYNWEDVADHLIANGVIIQKQGEWEESTNYDVGFWVCSVCNFTSEATAASKLYKYCPNCGAKMKEVK